MNKKIAVAALVVGGIAVGVAHATTKGAKATVLMTAEELKWVDVPNAPGVQTSVVNGDAAKGPHHFYLKFPAGFQVGSHHHTSDHYATIVKGTLVLTIDGKTTRLAPGSYAQMLNKVKHATGCEAGSECIMFIDSRGKWDAVMEKTDKM